MFKNIKERVLAVFAPSPTDNSNQTAARQRRYDALIQFAQAGFTLLIGFWIAPLFYEQEMLVIVAAGVCSVPFVIQGFKLLFSNTPEMKSTTTNPSPSLVVQSRRASKLPRSQRRNARIQQTPQAVAPNHQSEDAIGILLSDLQQQGWKMKYNLPIPNLGEVDVFLQSPNKNYFIVNFQSYRGEVFFDEGILKRRDWKGISHFEQDLLQQMMAQSLALQTMKRLRSVTSVLCFSESTLSIETVNNKALDVYVVKKESLVRKLLRLDRG
ncbi:NERD domain-containing protein [Allocoleopsis franciscana]|uniref:NERD domain-containing protein n=1 Tax=Allocoleopsis franciscana PCC 7113 TaxID=1173027 RepID=K9WBN0_9CYAN|nr:NERD domain-containing protein [Allocoleopsis franciscana]AFZ17795.1 hypothetical protein Mic7113_1945 [Allocoleopsis franciscana PCC 7113]